MDVDKHIEKAEEALKRRNYDFAINLYQQILLINPNNLKARKGFFEASLKNYDRKRAGKGAKAKKGRSNFGSTLSIFMRSGGRKDPAIIMSACDKVISRNPRDSLAHEKLGYAASKAGHLRRQSSHSKKYSSSSPTACKPQRTSGGCTIGSAIFWKPSKAMTGP